MLVVSRIAISAAGRQVMAAGPHALEGTRGSISGIGKVGSEITSSHKQAVGDGNVEIWGITHISVPRVAPICSNAIHIAKTAR